MLLMLRGLHRRCIMAVVGDSAAAAVGDSARVGDQTMVNAVRWRDGIVVGVPGLVVVVPHVLMLRDIAAVVVVVVPPPSDIEVPNLFVRVLKHFDAACPADLRM